MDECDKKKIEPKDLGESQTDPSSQQMSISNILDEAMSQSMFPLSPAYDLDSEPMPVTDENPITSGEKPDRNGGEIKEGESPSANTKRKPTDEPAQHIAKMQKLEQACIQKINQSLDDEVSRITSRNVEDPPSTSKTQTPIKVSKRSNSTEASTTPKTPRSRSASADITKQKTPRRAHKIKTMENLSEEIQILLSDSSSSRPSVEFVKEIPAPKKPCQTIPEEVPSDLNDSQDFHLEMSPLPENLTEEAIPKSNYSSDPVIVKDRDEVISADRLEPTRSEGYNYSDQSSNLSQPLRPNDKGTDQETTDSVCSTSMESPDNIPKVTSKLIKKLSNGNSSTPTEQGDSKNGVISISDSDSTPDMLKLNNKKVKRGIESFRTSNSTTPSTISPLQNGHSLPLNMNTPQTPVFDIHVSHNEDGDFLSLYVVRTDNDMGTDMFKEYQRFSKRFTIDPYLGDVSTNNSPSSVTSAVMINLPNRTSFASTTSSMSSNRTSDGNFVVPLPPRKSVSHPESLTVKGCDSLLKKLHEIVNHMHPSNVDSHRSDMEEKVSVGIQASPNGHSSTNGNASPEEVSKCDKTTPKSSLKKTRVRGRRPIGSKTKRAILPTQSEEPEYMEGMNSPEMVPVSSENGIASPSKDDKPLASLVGTPKSVNKLKQKKQHPVSPRPATPVEKIKQEYPGYPPDTVVLAKWVDKRYYSGKVIEITEPNKYLIKFDDGQTKALIDDFIIFGDNKVLPLQGQSVYAMVDEEQNYEPGLVLEVDENSSGTITYRCTTDGEAAVSVTATELYLTEDQARSIKESARARSPATPSTPRRRGLRELDLDNIIQGPRSARTRDKGSSSSKKRIASPKSPKASTSGLKSSKSTPAGRKRVASESSSLSESSNPAPAPARLEEVPGVEPEVQRTPRKIDGVKAGPLHLKGLAKQNVGKKNSKLVKFPADAATISQLGPIPAAGSSLFAGIKFLLTCADAPAASHKDERETRHYSSEEDGETTASMAGTDTEDLEFSSIPFNKERLKEQLEAGGGTVYSHFEDIEKSEYPSLRLIAPRPCLTAKYIQCLAGGVRALGHGWVAASCRLAARADEDAHALPPGWAIRHQRFTSWDPPTGKRDTQVFKDRVVLLCGDQDTFVKYWERVCSLAGATTREVNEEDLNVAGAIACVTDWDCPHEVQNKANQDNIPLVSTTWVVQCLIEAKLLPPTSHDKFSFMYTEPE